MLTFSKIQQMEKQIVSKCDNFSSCFLLRPLVEQVVGWSSGGTAAEMRCDGCNVRALHNNAVESIGHAHGRPLADLAKQLATAS